MAALPSISARRPATRRRIATQRPHLLLVANGSASGFDQAALDRVDRELRIRGASVERRMTANLDELRAVWDEADGRRVVLLGGDGSVHAAVNLPGARPELALIPAGRANNIARSTGIPLDPAAAAALAVEGTARPLDLIEASSRDARVLAVEGVSSGLHAIARAGYRAPNSADVRAGAHAGLRAARSFAGLTASIMSDGVQDVVRIGQLFVANMPLFAFGLRVAPAARPDDGLLDVVTLDWRGPARLVPSLLRVRRGDHIGRPGVRTWRARRVRISTAGASPVIADTTNLGSGWVDLRLLRGELGLVTP
jgi:diacylglycerol kinase (ATP)